MIDLFNYKWTTDDGSPLNKSNPWMWYDSDAVYVDNGTAELSAYKEPNQLQDWEGNIFNPTVACGMLRSVDTFGYGIFSAEIMLPKGKNLWPCFWLVGSGEDWPKGGEIDIVEAWTNQFGGYYKMCKPQPPYFIPLNYWNTTTNVHWGKDKEHHESCGSRRLPIIFSLKRPAHNFVKYEVEWRPDIITFRANGKRVRTYGYHVAKRLNGKRMRVIIDLWTTSEDFTCEAPMKIRNFEYKPIEVI